MITCARCHKEADPFKRCPEGPVCEDCLNEQDGE